MQWEGKKGEGKGRDSGQGKGREGNPWEGQVDIEVDIVNVASNIHDSYTI